MKIFEWISQNANAIAVLVAAVSALISAISAIVAFCANWQNRRQYQDSIQPQLSMSLIEYGPWLYLKIKNTGRSPAQNIKITLDKIINNGEHNQFDPDVLFSNNFELYPEEGVQGRVALQGADIIHTIFPQISISVSYNSPIKKKRYSYSRTVTYQSAYSQRIIADVHMDTDRIENSLDIIMRAVVRMANYLDGRQVAPFDKLNILAHQSLKNDLMAAMGKPTEHILTRHETIDETRKKASEGMRDVK